jgi:hypothetical protein
MRRPDPGHGPQGAPFSKRSPAIRAAALYSLIAVAGLSVAIRHARYSGPRMLQWSPGLRPIRARFRTPLGIPRSCHSAIQTWAALLVALAGVSLLAAARHGECGAAADDKKAAEEPAGTAQQPAP